MLGGRYGEGDRDRRREGGREGGRESRVREDRAKMFSCALNKCLCVSVCESFSVSVSLAVAVSVCISRRNDRGAKVYESCVCGWV
jgi:hypothetical protein